MSIPTTSDTSLAEHTRWFLEEVRPHESSLRAYLRSRFPALEDIDNLVQETYARLLRVRAAGPVASAKSLLFATARNAALDQFRRRQVISFESIAEMDRLSVLEDRPDAAEAATHEDELQLLKEAIRALPRRCGQVITLRKIYGLSHKEIAERLGIAENTVSAQISQGVERCRQYLLARGVRGLRRP